VRLVAQLPETLAQSKSKMTASQPPRQQEALARLAAPTLRL